MRLIDADALLEKSYRERLDSRELIEQMIESAPTVVVEEDNVALKKNSITGTNYLNLMRVQY